MQITARPLTEFGARRGFAPEIEILCRCARTSMDSEAAHGLAKLLRNGIDWEKLLALANRHQLAPLLYRHVKGACPDHVPNVVLTWLREVFMANAMQVRILTDELLHLLRHLESAGVAALPFKGPVLGRAVYGDLDVLRVSSDVDLLYSREDERRVERILHAFGYDTGRRYRGIRKRFVAALKDELHYHKRDSFIQVDLHSRLVPRFHARPAGVRELLERADRVDLGGMSLPTLGAEDLLLYLCLHGSRHQWSTLKWYCDVRETIQRRPDLDWDVVFTRAQAWRAERALRLGLNLAGTVLGVDLPREVFSAMQSDASVVRLADRIIVHRLTDERRSSLAIRRRLFNLLIRDRAIDRLRYCSYLPLMGALEIWATSATWFVRPRKVAA